LRAACHSFEVEYNLTAFAIASAVRDRLSSASLLSAFMETQGLVRALDDAGGFIVHSGAATSSPKN
jgi:hypothetical protein